MTPKRFTWKLTEDSDGDACWTCEREDHGLFVYPYDDDGRVRWNASVKVSVDYLDLIDSADTKAEAIQIARRWSLKRESEVSP